MGTLMRDRGDEAVREIVGQSWVRNPGLGLHMTLAELCEASGSRRDASFQSKVASIVRERETIL